MSKEKTLIVSVSKEGGYIAYQDTIWSEWKPQVAGEKLLTHSFLMDSFRKIMGRVLTVVDSSVVDPQQNKAMKDLVRNIISDEMKFAADMCFDQKEIQKLMPETFDEMPEAVSIEEVLGVKE